MTCGCRVDIQIHGEVIGTFSMYTGSDPPHIVYCPTHAAAFDLLGALAARTDHGYHDCVGHRECAAFPAEAFAVGLRLVVLLRDGEVIE